MAGSAHTPTSARIFPDFRIPQFSVWLGVVVFLLLITHEEASAFTTGARQEGKAPACATVDLNFDDSTDVRATDEYSEAMAELLKQDSFDELDCIADSIRSSKARFPSGEWKLPGLYAGLDKPQQHGTQEDWANLIAHLERWVAAKPNSITARVALAKAYVWFAWDARGEGFSDTVSQSGWRLFGERMDKAKEILDAAASLPNKCPEWYAAMQQVAFGQGWDVAQETALLQRAIAFEPGYDGYYTAHAVFLLPKWHGDDGDAARFAEQSADRLGRKEGDALYFQIAASITSDPEFARMSWPRIQKGFAELEQERGPSLTNLNAFALMAAKANDSPVADDTFKRIGDNWSEKVWISEKYFKSNKQWASDMAPTEREIRATQQAADANAQTPEGQAYKKKFDAVLAGFIQKCMQTAAGSDTRRIELLIQVGTEGDMEGDWTLDGTPLSQCVTETLMRTREKKENPFPHAPRPTYWMKVDVDPATLNVASK
jgi:hypothetical protein